MQALAQAKEFAPRRRRLFRIKAAAATTTY